MRKFKWVKSLVSKPDFWPIVIVLFFGLLAGKGLIGSGYFNMHDDLQLMRQLEMEKCFLDGQIPCRWVPDMGYGFGYPLFNFYPPLPYLVGEAVRLFGFTFISTAKILFIFSFLASGVTMYYLTREFFGKFGAVVSSIFYIWAPYHAVDVYVRGAMNEAWALIWFPAILYFSYKLIKSPTSHKASRDTTWLWVIGLSMSWFALFTSHNLMVLVFSPFFAVWCLIWLYRFKSWKRIPSLLISGAWSFGLAAFFTLPVLLEKGIVQTDTLVVGYYEYTAHFADISQLLFSRFWGYGPSVWGSVDDRMSFQVGWIHWILPLVILVLIIRKFKNDKKLGDVLVAVLFFFVVGWFAAFLAHSRSTPIWKLIEAFQFVQFPWRFLTIVILAFSFIAGSVTKLLPKSIHVPLSILLVAGVLIYSFNYFLPEHGHLGPLTDEEKFSNAAWELQQTAGIYDYLPNTAKTAPKAPMTELAEIIDGEGEVSSEELGTNWAKFSIDLPEDSKVRVGILQFPNWTAYVDGNEIDTYVDDKEQWGRIYIDVPKGSHDVELKLYNTPVRTLGNWISVLSWGVLLFVVLPKLRNGKI